MPLGLNPISSAAASALTLAGSGITVRGTANSSNVNASAVSVPIPTGTTVGDVTLIAIAQFQSATSFTVPSGWTAVRNIPGAVVLYRVYQSGDPTSVTVSSGTTAYMSAISISYTGCDTTNPIDVAEGCMTCNGSGSSTPSYIAPSLNPNFNGSQLVCAYMSCTSAAGGAFTPPAGMTTQKLMTSGPSVAFADKVLVDGTPTGPQVVSWGATGAGNSQFAVAVALKAAGATAATVAAATAVPIGAIKYQYTSGTSFTFPFNRFSVQPGDILFATFTAGNGSLANAAPSGVPSGWTLIDSTAGNYLYAHTQASGDPTSVNFTGPGTYTQAAIFAVRGMGASTIQIDTVGHTSVTSGTTLSTPSLAPSTNGDLVLAYYGVFTSTGTSLAITSALTTLYNEGGGPSSAVGFMSPSANPSDTFAVTANAARNMSAFAILIAPVTPGTYKLTGSQAKGYGRVVSPASTLAPPGKQALAKSGLTALGSAAALLGAQANAYGRAVAPAIGPVLLNAKALAPIGVLSPSSTIGLTGAAANGYAGIVLVAAGVLVDLTGVQALGRSGQVLTELAPVLLRGRALAKSGIPVAARTVSAGGTSAASYGRQVGPQTELAARGRAADALTGALELQQTFGVTRAAADAFAGRVMTTSDFVARLTGQRAVAKAGRAVYAPELFTWWVTAAARGGKVGKTSAVQVPRQAADGVVGQLGFSEGANRTLAAARAAAQAHRIPAQISIALLPAAAAGRAGMILPAGQLIGQLAEARAGRFPATLQLALEGYRAIARAGQPGFGEGSGTPIGVWTGPSYAAPLSQVPHAAPTTGEVGALATTGQQTATTVTQKTAVASILSPNNIFIVSD